MIVVKASIVVALACAVAALMRTRSAATRHAVLAVAIGCAGLMPLFERIAPGWGVIAPAGSLSTVGAAERDILRFIWLGGAAVGLAMLIAGLVRIARTQSRARRCVDPWRLAMLGEVSAELGIDRSVRLLESDDPVMPVTWGAVRPRILLPFVARQWPDDRVRAVLRHELAHVRRGDWIVNVLVELIARAMWFTPVLWMARRQLRRESERACDDVVLNLGVDGAEYATHLLDVARELRRSRPIGAVAPAMSCPASVESASPDAVARAGAGLLERRIAAVLNAGLNRTPVTVPASVAVLALLLGLTMPIAGFGVPPAPLTPARPLLLDVQRDIMMRFGGEQRRFSIVSRDVSFWKNRIEGRVELQARLNVDGSVSGVRLVEPVHPDLASAAEVIVRQWRREPARLRGVPVEVPIRMTVDFRR